MSELDEKLDRFIKSVDLRIGEIERQLKEQRRADERISEDFNLPPNLSHVGTGIQPQPGAVRSTSQPDTQGEFQTLKDSLSKVKLPADVKLNDSRQGIKRTDQPLMNALAKCGRYCETGIKLLCSLEAGTEFKQETLDNLFLIQYAQIKYLQEEYAALLVNGQFDASTAKIFRSLQKNTSGFDRIRSKRFEQRQRYRQLGVQRAVLQRTDSRPDVVFLGLVEVVNVGRTTAGHRTGTCSSHLLTDSSREGLLGKITT